MARRRILAGAWIGKSSGSGCRVVAGSKVYEPLSSMDCAKRELAFMACTWRYRSMASDFHRPRSWMDCLSILAQSRAVAPPGLRLRALMSSGGMPVVSLRRSAACRSALVMCEALTVRWAPSFA